MQPVSSVSLVVPSARCLVLGQAVRQAMHRARREQHHHRGALTLPSTRPGPLAAAAQGPLLCVPGLAGYLPSVPLLQPQPAIRLSSVDGG